MDFEDRPICRICHEPEDTTDPSPGARLFSPCKCKGSVRFVHRECLDHWRTVSQNPHSYFQCDQCKYRYNLRRVQYSNFIGRPVVLEIASSLMFLLLMYCSAKCMQLLLFPLFSLNVHHADDHAPASVITSESKAVEEVYKSNSKLCLEHWVAGVVAIAFLGFVLYATLHCFGRRLPAVGIHNAFDGTVVVDEGILVVVVFIGVWIAFKLVYNFLKEFGRKGLNKIEDVVLEVGPG